MRHAARRDANDQEISAALRAAGFTVLDFGKAGQGVPDKLVVRGERPWLCWVEIKTPKGRIRETQKAFKRIFEPRGEYYVARDAELAVRDLMERYVSARP